MEATLEAERRVAEASASIGRFELFKGRNGIRMLISLWPKLMQQVRERTNLKETAPTYTAEPLTLQFVGLTLFNTYSTYFCESWSSPIRMCSPFG
jgi:SP family general alpha glucoside:H+ symporter-like MFS transporter